MKIILPLEDKISEAINKNMCHICKKKFQHSDIRVRNHHHTLPLGIIGYAHQSCNLAYQTTYTIPVIIHNLKNYDSHFILKEIPSNLFNNITIIPSTFEKFSSFTLDEVKFIDSYSFLNASLDALTRNLINDGHEFKIFNKIFGSFEKKELLKRKGIFPYSYFSDLSVLKEKNLPPKECFYNILSGETITNDEYDHAKLVWTSFSCKSFYDYLLLYQITDVVLLAEVFQNYRKSAYDVFELEVVSFLSSPQLSWTAGLKHSKVNLELFTDYEMYSFIERGIRGGVCFNGRRYAKANNKYIPNTYDSNKPNVYIIMLDVNGLYSKALMEKLPISNFRFLSDYEIENFNLMDISDDSDEGYILEVDLHYPSKLHDCHNEYPLAVEHLKLSEDMMSDYQINLMKKFNIKLSSTTKLVPNFYDKNNYVVHYRNLKFYICHGLVIKKIHKILSFKQEAWIKSYIELNNRYRRNASSECEKNLYKLMNNSFFGKTCENPRKKINVRIATSSEECKRYLGSPNLENFLCLNENLALFKIRKNTLLLNKPIHVGFSVLELSKLWMYTLFYDKFVNFYKDKVKLLYTDTDSFVLEVHTADVYKDLKTYFSDIIDFSNYEITNSLHNEAKKNQPGLLKDETCGKPIDEFVGLKPKMYSLSCPGENDKKRAKGIKKEVIAKYTINDYKQILLNQNIRRDIQHSIISKNHNVFTQEQNKLSLSCFYDKKYIHVNGIDVSSLGHFRNK